MRKPQFASKKSRSSTGWWKHARPFGKRTVNKSERSGAKKDLKKSPFFNKDKENKNK